VSGKIKTSIVVDEKLWEKFKAKVGAEKGLKKLSEAVEDAIKEDLGEIIIANWLEAQLPGKQIPRKVTPVKPKTKTNAAAVLRKMREPKA